MANGVAALVAYLLRTALKSGGALPSSVASALRDAFVAHALRSLASERRLLDVVERLETSGIRHVVWKGWCHARRYATRVLRPYGDVDVLVHERDRGAVIALLHSLQAGPYLRVDVHTRLSPLEADDFDDLWERSESSLLGAVSVRHLGCEDELRHACLHWLKHGGERALWLCDIAALLEAAPVTLCAARVLRTSAARRAWILTTIGLARDLLGARVPGPLRAHLHEEPVPRWIVAALMRNWERKCVTRDRKVADYAKSPWTWPTVIRDRWPSPLVAGVSVGTQSRVMSQLAQAGMFAGAIANIVPRAVRVLRTDLT